MSLRQPDVVTVAVTRSDGGVTVLRIIENSYRIDDNGERYVYRHNDVTPAYIDREIGRYVADGHWVGPLAPVSWRVVPNDYMADGDDFTFRDAFADTGNGKPDVDMPKAREIHRKHLRRMRTPLLEQLDTDYLRADEAGDQQAKATIRARKQALRDVTADPAIDAAQTPAELKAVIPEALRG